MKSGSIEFGGENINFIESKFIMCSINIIFSINEYPLLFMLSEDLSDLKLHLSESKPSWITVYRNARIDKITIDDVDSTFTASFKLHVV